MDEATLRVVLSGSGTAGGGGTNSGGGGGNTHQTGGSGSGGGSDWVSKRFGSDIRQRQAEGINRRTQGNIARRQAQLQKEEAKRAKLEESRRKKAEADEERRRTKALLWQANKDKRTSADAARNANRARRRQWVTGGMMARSVANMLGNVGMGNAAAASGAASTAAFGIAAGLGAAGMAISAATVAIPAAMRAFTQYTEGVIARGRELQQYSASLAIANARAQMRSIRFDMDEAATNGPAYARLTEASSQLRDTINRGWLATGVGQNVATGAAVVMEQFNAGLTNPNPMNPISSHFYRLRQWLGILPGPSTTETAIDQFMRMANMDSPNLYNRPADPARDAADARLEIPAFFP